MVATNTNVLQLVRKRAGKRQQDVADALGIPQSTYAYKEASGTFDEDEKRKIAKYLKTDMTNIVWKSSILVKSTDDRDLKIRQQEQKIIELEATVKALQEMIDKLLQNR